jgi:type III pantothenate kinase
MLLIDAGNSRIKSAVFNGGALHDHLTMDTAVRQPPRELVRRKSPERVLISNVAGSEVAEKLTDWVSTAWSIEPELVEVRAEAAGVTTNYDDITKLGVDRWLAVLAAYSVAKSTVAVVDAGTALTLDYVSDEGVHLGGSIAPGLNLMLDSLTRNTARLYLDRVQPTNGIATNTASAISTGCVDALIGGIERALNNFAMSQNIQPQLLITGGGAAQIMELCQINFRHVPDLVLQGLALAAAPQ